MKFALHLNGILHEIVVINRKNITKVQMFIKTRNYNSKVFINIFVNQHCLKITSLFELSILIKFPAYYQFITWQLLGALNIEANANMEYYLAGHN